MNVISSLKPYRFRQLTEIRINLSSNKLSIILCANSQIFNSNKMRILIIYQLFRHLDLCLIQWSVSKATSKNRYWMQMNFTCAIYRTGIFLPLLIQWQMRNREIKMPRWSTTQMMFIWGYVLAKSFAAKTSASSIKSIARLNKLVNNKRVSFIDKETVWTYIEKWEGYEKKDILIVVGTVRKNMSR